MSNEKLSSWKGWQQSNSRVGWGDGNKCKRQNGLYAKPLKRVKIIAYTQH